MKKTRLFMLVGVALLSLALVGMALAGDSVPQSPPTTGGSITTTTTTSSGTDANPVGDPGKAKPEEPQGAPIPLQAGITGVSTDYGWSQTTGTYTEITGGTQVTTSCDDTSYNNYTIPFSFSFNGTAYTALSIQCNGFIAMGTSISSSYTPISSGTSNQVVSALGQDLQTGISNSELRYQVLGTTPNQVFVIQWKNFRHYAGSQVYNFQIRLYETSNVVEVVYGSFTETSSYTTQVGIRGASNADFNNRMSSTGWTNTVVGTLNTDTVLLSSAYFPSSGLTWDWTPTPPHPVFDGSYKTATAQVVIGNPIDYVVHIINSGTGNANSATMNDPIPLGTTYNNDVTCSSGTCGFDGSNVTWVGSVAVAGEVTVSFSVGTAEMGCGDIVINSATMNDPGLYGGPVTKSASTLLISVAPALSESFDGVTFPPTDWGQEYIVGTSNWDRQTSGTYPTILPHSGAAMARWNSFSFSSGNSTRLYSPIITITSGDWFKFYMSHDTGYSANADSITPQISIDGGTTWTDLDAPILRYDATYTTPGWSENKYDLSAYQGQTNVRIGLLAYSAYGNNIFVDDVSVAPAWYPCPSITIGPDQNGSSCPGSSQSYPLTVQNINPQADTIDITPIGNLWPTTVNPDAVVLDPNQSAVVMVTVDIPPDAVYPTTDSTTILAIGEGSGLSASALINTSVKPASGMADDWLNVATGGEPSFFWGHSYYYNGEVCVLGGLTGSTPGLTGIHNCYNISTGTWSARPAIPTPVFAGAYGLIGDKFYIVGGFMDSAFTGTNLVQIYDITNATWSTGAVMPSARGGAAGGVVNGLLYSAGGSGTSSFPVDCPTYAYDPVANTWSTLAACPLQGGYGLDLGGSVGSEYWGLLFAGGHFGAYSGWFSYDPAANTWTTLANLPGGIHKTPLIVENPITGQIYMVGGMVGWLGQNTTYEYDQTGNTWTLLPLATLGTAQGGSTGPDHGSFGDLSMEGFWTVGGTNGSGSISPAPFEVWQYNAEMCPAGPKIVVTPLSLLAEQLPDTITTQQLQICNQGPSPLDWSITEVPPSKNLSDQSKVALPTKANVNTTQSENVTPFEGVITQVGTGLQGSTDSSGLGNPEDVLYNNGPLVTIPAACSGMDASRLQTDLAMNTLGFGHQYSLGYRMADDFTITDPAGWQINQLTLFAYQTGAPASPSPIAGMYYQIWDGPPDDPGSSVVFGDLTTNRLVSSTNPNMQRDSVSSPCANNRYIFADVVSAGFTLPPGTYWIDWSTDGNPSYSGPWAPPITILGQTTTGNAIQYTTAWAPALDTGTATQQGIPFIIEGTVLGGYDIPWLSESPITGTVEGFACIFVDVSFDSTGLAPGTYTGGLNVNSNDPATPVVPVDVTLNVLALPNISVDPSFLESTLFPNTQETQNLNVCNTGQADLVWHLAEVPGLKVNSVTPITNRAANPPRQVALTLGNLPGSGKITNSPVVPKDAVSFVVDDGSVDNNIGLNDGVNDYQFLWFNRFTPDPANFPFNLEQIQVFFDTSTGVVVGDAIDLVVYQDADGDPSTGATWLATYNVTVQVVDGVTWSVYDLPSPLLITGPGDVLIGAVNRYAVSGVSPATFPAALDQTASQMRSWVASYSADPPDPPTLPADGLFGLIDDYFPGNWMVRGYGETIVADIPWLSETPTSGTVLPGDCTTINVTFDSTGLALGTYNGSLDITSNDPDEPEVTVPVTLTVALPVSDLSVIKTASADVVRVGDMITYTLVVNNAGGDDAIGVVLTDTLPTLVTFVSASPQCAEVAGVVTCDIGDLAADENITLTIVVTAVDVGTATNTAEVSSVQVTDPNPENNIDTAVTTINPELYYFYLSIVQKH